MPGPPDAQSWESLMKAILTNPEFASACEVILNTETITDFVLAEAVLILMDHCKEHLDGTSRMLLAELRQERSDAAGATCAVMAAMYFVWGVQVGTMTSPAGSRVN